MAARGTSRRRGVVRAQAPAPPIAPATIAWIVTLPCALALLAAIVVLGSPLGRAFFLPHPEAFWPFWRERLGIVPEPSEHARFLLALLGPVLVSGAVVLGARRPPRLPPATRRVLALGAQALVPAFVIAMLVAQQRKVYGQPYSSVPFHHVYFTPATLAVAVLVATLLALALHSRVVVARVGAWTRETAWSAAAGFVLAALLTAVWLLTAIHTDASIANANSRILVNIPFWLDEPFAVLNGHGPLVDYHAQYGQLLAYVVALPMALLGTSIGVWSVTLAVGDALAMLAVYASLRRVVRRSLLALAIYVPVLATGFFMEEGPAGNRQSPASLVSVFPSRYLGAYALLWLTARHLDGAAPRRRWALWVVAGLVIVNNVEFGLPAFAGALAAIVLTAPPRSRAQAGRLLADVALGLLVAVVLVALLTLVYAGSLPHFAMMLTFSRVYAVDGFGMMPMPALGLHLVLYLTFAAAIVVAVARAVAGERDRLLTGLLAWSGVFGLGAGAYYAGRSLPEVLLSIFSIWALALALLLVAVAREILSRPSRRPRIAEVVVLFGCGLAVCSVAQTPTPWSQVRRLSRTSARPFYAHTATERFIGRATSRGERVAILTHLGHRIAYDLDISNVAPYANIESMPLIAQLDESIAVLRAAGGRKLFLPTVPTETYPEQLAAVERAGFRPVRRDANADVVELIDETRPGGARE